MDEAFAYLKRRGRNVVIAIDEFQQILEFPETGTEALLRGYVQSVPDVRFVFADVSGGDCYDVYQSCVITKAP